MVVGAAWATPAILVATSSPPAAASGGAPATSACSDADNGTAAVVTALGWEVKSGSVDAQYGTNGWTPAVAGDSMTITNDWMGIGTAEGFKSMDDNATTTTPAVLVARYAFTAVRGAVYTVDFTSKVQYGGGSNSSSRQSMVLTVDDAAGSSTLTKLSIPHTSAYGGWRAMPPGNTSDAQMAEAGYDLQAHESSRARSVQVTGNGGQAVLTFTFTVEPIATGEANPVSDDIWVSLPTVTQVACAS